MQNETLALVILQCTMKQIWCKHSCFKFAQVRSKATHWTSHASVHIYLGQWTVITQSYAFNKPIYSYVNWIEWIIVCTFGRLDITHSAMIRTFPWCLLIPGLVHIIHSICFSKIWRKHCIKYVLVYTLCLDSLFIWTLSDDKGTSMKPQESWKPENKKQKLTESSDKRTNRSKTTKDKRKKPTQLQVCSWNYLYSTYNCKKI